MMKKKRMTLLVFPLLIWIPSVLIYGQVRLDDLYVKAKKIKFFESSRKDIESVFKPESSIKESSESGGTKTIWYDLSRARLTVYYSTGKCTTRSDDGNGYDVDRDIVLGLDIFYFKPVKTSMFGLRLSDFSKYRESDNNAIIFTNEQLGLQLTGDERKLRSIEVNPTEIEDAKHRCKPELDRGRSGSGLGL